MSVIETSEGGCEGQMSLFSGFLKEKCSVKPEIGRKLIFHYEGKDYIAQVTKHCGWDFFYINFLGKTPADDDEKIGKTEGWHVCLRGYKEDWDFWEENQ